MYMYMYNLILDIALRIFNIDVTIILAKFHNKYGCYCIGVHVHVHTCIGCSWIFLETGFFPLSTSFPYVNYFLDCISNTVPVPCECLLIYIVHVHVHTCIGCSWIFLETGFFPLSTSFPYVNYFLDCISNTVPVPCKCLLIYMYMYVYLHYESKESLLSPLPPPL